MLVGGIPLWVRLVSLAIGYCFGLILLGYILGKLAHVDIRKEGSGNVGTTNAVRVLGAKAGLITLVFDISKAWMAAFVVWLIFHSTYTENIRLLMIYAAFGAVLGHDFPFYIGFKGGKGVATGIAFFAIVVPVGIPVLVLEFIVIVVLTGYVSLGSIIGAVSAVIELFLFYGLGLLPYGEADFGEIAVLTVIAALILIIKHRANIGRLLSGTENKFSLHKKT
ncbi:MAG: glycerol-3-phosphate 1-O-acyltransferase PlsY [Lachnospiraceae bacterium]|nr:glycerol-3-phosphate 1-O-acyltransferase PlsY [Lachnospiraceae bacterium]